MEEFRYLTLSSLLNSMIVKNPRNPEKGYTIVEMNFIFSIIIILQGHLDVELNDIGRQQAAAVS